MISKGFDWLQRNIKASKVQTRNLNLACVVFVDSYCLKTPNLTVYTHTHKYIDIILYAHTHIPRRQDVTYIYDVMNIYRDMKGVEVSRINFPSSLNLWCGEGPDCSDQTGSNFDAIALVCVCVFSRLVFETANQPPNRYLQHHLCGLTSASVLLTSSYIQ